MNHYIYALVDPREPTIVRYVGCSTQIGPRLSKHYRRPNSGALRQWHKSLSEVGLCPTFVLLAQADNPERATELEGEMIAQHQSGVLFNRQTPLPATLAGVAPLAEVERQHVLTTLEKCGGNKLLASRALGIGRQTLYNKLHLYACHVERS